MTVCPDPIGLQYICHPAACSACSHAVLELGVSLALQVNQCLALWPGPSRCTVGGIQQGVAGPYDSGGGSHAWLGKRPSSWACP